MTNMLSPGQSAIQDTKMHLSRGSFDIASARVRAGLIVRPYSQFSDKCWRSFVGLAANWAQKQNSYQFPSEVLVYRYNA